jgi:tricorn protease-like protein
VTVETKAVTLVDTATAFEIREYAWSPDSMWIAWIRPEDDSLTKVWLYTLDGAGRKLEVTDGWYGVSDAPAFSDDGKFLLLASSRDFRPTAERHRARARLQEPRAGVPPRAREGHGVALQAEASDEVEIARSHTQA